MDRPATAPKMAAPSSTRLGLRTPGGAHNPRKGSAHSPHKQQSKQRDPVGSRHALAAETPRSEAELYVQRINEISAQRTKVVRDFQQKIASNRARVRMMHEENTHLRSIRAGGKDVTARELELLDKRKYTAIRRLNRLSHQVRKIEEGIQTAEEVRANNEKELSLLTREGTATGCKSVALRIQRLENFLDRILGHQRFVARINESYNELLQELLKDSVGRDTRTRFLEQSVGVRHQDYARLVVLYHNATSLHEKAQGDLRRFDQFFQQSRKLKDKALAERRNYVEAALRQTQRQELRYVELQQEIDEELQRLEEIEVEKQVMHQRRQRSLSATERLQSCISTADGKLSSRANDRLNNVLLVTGSAKDEERMRTLETSFTRMMRVTEAQTLEDLFLKFKKEQGLREQLKLQSEKEQERYEEIHEEVKRLRKKVKEHGIRHVHCTPMTSCMRSELEGYIKEAMYKRDLALEKVTEMEHTVAEVLKNTDVLGEQVSCYRPEVQISQTQIENLITNLEVLQVKIVSLADDTVGQNPTTPCVGSMYVKIPGTNTRIKRFPSRPKVDKNKAPTTLTPLENHNNSEACDSCLLGTESCLTDSLVNGIVPVDAAKFGASVVSSDSGDDEMDSEEGKGAIALLDNDEPLGREQIKRLAALVLRREDRRKLREDRQR
uniref:Uncharacterized protein n=1 Tax=Trypanosoma congolense (strain IL3000) TaxID=1068625 RepID=G0US31_TRYCI|nr:conserved hypothetical protein [Trypanosoma congolense IL3000]